MSGAPFSRQGPRGGQGDLDTLAIIVWIVIPVVIGIVVALGVRWGWW